MGSSVFRKESMDRVSSPEQLNDYIKVSNVNVWIIIGAAIILLVCVFVWAVLGSLSTTVSAACVTHSGETVCYVSDVGQLKVGDTAKFEDGTTGTITSISSSPLSESEIAAKYDDFVVYSLSLAQWSYEVYVDAPSMSDGVSAVEFVVESVNPISFIWG